MAPSGTHSGVTGKVQQGRPGSFFDLRRPTTHRWAGAHGHVPLQSTSLPLDALAWKAAHFFDPGGG